MKRRLLVSIPVILLLTLIPDRERPSVRRFTVWKNPDGSCDWRQLPSTTSRNPWLLAADSTECTATMVVPPADYTSTPVGFRR